MKILTLLPALLALSTTLLQAAPLALNETEQQWLNDHPDIRLGIDPDWAPFEFRDKDNNYRGMGADFISLISQRLGACMR